MIAGATLRPGLDWSLGHVDKWRTHIHTILTELPVVAPLVRETIGDGIQFAEQPRNRNTIISRPMRFDMICEGVPKSAIGPRTMARGIEHRLTKPNHPWTNGQVERMNRTIKDATIKRYHYDSHEQLRSHLVHWSSPGFVDGYGLENSSMSRALLS